MSASVVIGQQQRACLFTGAVGGNFKNNIKNGKQGTNDSMYQETCFTLAVGAGAAGGVWL